MPIMTRRAGPVARIDPDLARLGAALADPSRVAMLDALLDGKPHPIGSLARRAGITAATASGHLRRLVDDRLVTVTRAGREHRVALASPEVAQLLETMAALAPPSPAFTAAAGARARELRAASTCYDHLAGVLGVRITAALVDRGWLVVAGESYTATPRLTEWIAAHGTAVADSRRPLVRACIDWSERLPHLAGRLGAAVCDLALAERWVARVRDSRALRVTDRGRRAFAAELGVALR